MSSTTTRAEAVSECVALDAAEQSIELVKAGQRPNPFLCGTVYEVKGWRKWLLLWPASLLLRLYYATLRVRIDPADEKALREISRPLVGITWHNRSFVFPMIARRFRIPSKTFCLISPSKAAAWEDGIFHFLGIPSSRGSSSRRSIAAVRELLHENSRGNDIFIAPDGPVGPRYEFKRGAAFTARVTKSPMLLIGAECNAAWRPHTWDRHFLPLPFSKVRLRAILLENGEIFAKGCSDDEACKLLARKLNSINADNGI
jgi:lysophospholipid acyltransferase (LPLAT)-like uncharacterized protein